MGCVQRADAHPENDPQWRDMPEAPYDDEGHLMPGVVDPQGSLEEQQAQLQARLVRQGLAPQQAASMAADHYAVPIVIRDESAREVRQAELNDVALQGIDEFEPGSATEVLADAGTSNSASDSAATPRWRKLQDSLARLAEADTPFLVERNQAFLKAQIGKYEQLEAQAQANGDNLLVRNLRDERALFEATLVRLDARLTEVDYGVAALRYADTLAAKPDAAFSRREIMQAVQRLVAGTSIPDSAVDEYVRRMMAGDETKLLLTILGGGSIVALIGQDGSGAGSPRLQRIPNGAAQAKGYDYRFDELGRVSNTRGELTLKDGTRNPGAQRDAGGADRLPSDDGGHIVGNRFYPPTEEFNLFAQDRSFNRGVYNQLEKEWAGALGQGKSVKVEWQFKYSGSSVRPDRLTVTYYIDGQRFVRPFSNQVGGKP